MAASSPTDRTTHPSAVSVPLSLWVSVCGRLVYTQCRSICLGWRLSQRHQLSKVFYFSFSGAGEGRELSVLILSRDRCSPKMSVEAADQCRFGCGYLNAPAEGSVWTQTVALSCRLSTHTVDLWWGHFPPCHWRPPAPHSSTAPPEPVFSPNYLNVRAGKRQTRYWGPTADCYGGPPLTGCSIRCVRVFPRVSRGRPGAILVLPSVNACRFLVFVRFVWM